MTSAKTRKILNDPDFGSITVDSDKDTLQSIKEKYNTITSEIGKKNFLDQLAIHYGKTGEIFKFTVATPEGFSYWLKTEYARIGSLKFQIPQDKERANLRLDDCLQNYSDFLDIYEAIEVIDFVNCLTNQDAIFFLYLVILEYDHSLVLSIYDPELQRSKTILNKEMVRRNTFLEAANQQQKMKTTTSQDREKEVDSAALEGLRNAFRDTTTREIFDLEWGKVLKKSPDSKEMISQALIFFQHHIGIEATPYKWEVIRDKTNSLPSAEGLKYLDAFIRMGKYSFYAGITCYTKTGTIGIVSPYESIVEQAIEKKQILEISLRTVNEKQAKKIISSNETYNKIRWEKSEAGLAYLFELLYMERFITQSSYDKRTQFMEEFFENKEGKSFNRRQSSQAETNSRNNSNPKHKGKPKDAPQLEKLVNKLSENIGKMIDE